MDELLPCPFCGGANVSVNPVENTADSYLKAALWAAACGDWYSWDVNIHKWREALESQSDRTASGSGGA
jgi:hypothetical protein